MEQEGLFQLEDNRPLADVLRPKNLDEIVGQEHILGPDGLLHLMLEQNKAVSFILWGPPGCGKTTLARLISKSLEVEFEALSAIFSGVADLRKIFERAKIRYQDGLRTCLFVDEIHRFNRAQQDSFLPYVENGTIILIGATTENPSFELNAALLSRCQVFTLKALDDEALEKILKRAEVVKERPLPLTEKARQAMRNMADGDGRYLLNLAETIYGLGTSLSINTQKLVALIQRRAPVYDKQQESHYNLISALHKSIRGSDVDGALYWFARMIKGGEDPRFLARRLLRMAYEDIGLADPQAAIQAKHAWETFERLGSPEGELALAQVVIYLATAPKSNACYMAYNRVMEVAEKTGSVPPPKHILQGATALMRKEGYGVGYEYDPDMPDGFSGQNYFPETLPRTTFYEPVERGFERKIRQRLEYWEDLRKKRGKV